MRSLKKLLIEKLREATPRPLASRTYRFNYNLRSLFSFWLLILTYVFVKGQEMEESSLEVAYSARDAMKKAFGDTSDLPYELVNTICNLYYFAFQSQKFNFGGLKDLKDLYPRLSERALLKFYIRHMSHVVPSVQHASEMITSLRAVSNESPEIGRRLEQITIDALKYGILPNYSSFRRGIVRHFKRVNEYPDLAILLKLTFRKKA